MKGQMPRESVAPDPPADTLPRFMSVRQVAGYLHINEKKVYELVREDKIPATKITGKWVFPRELVDRWLLESSHGGLFTDRLLVVGSDDPLLAHVVLELATTVAPRALVSYSPTGTQLGLGLLAALRADVSGIHWGRDSESRIRHPALLQRFASHKTWLLVRAFRREQGLMLRPGLLPRQTTAEALLANLRWSVRQDGAGSRRFMQELLAEHNLDETCLHVVDQSLSEREAAAHIAMGKADAAPGVRACATEFGLVFIPTGWEAFDFALKRGVYFRALFQKLLDALHGQDTTEYARQLGGYDLEPAGELIWGMD
jgi:putative molybdopterin biosynthesis protein